MTVAQAEAPVKSEMKTPILLLAHGAGASVSSDFMQAISLSLASKGVRVICFNFAYMAQSELDGKRRPPPKVDKLVEEYRYQLEQLKLQTTAPIYIGGKSMGGRVASMLAAQNMGVAGCVCLGYPFHPPKKPESLRTAHLQQIAVPTLIVQGERDPFGSKEDVGSYVLSSDIQLHWLADADHDFSPRKSSGFTQSEHINSAALAISHFMTVKS